MIPGPLIAGFRFTLDMILWAAGALSALVAVVLVLAFVAWLLNVWDERANPGIVERAREDGRLIVNPAPTTPRPPPPPPPPARER